MDPMQDFLSLYPDNIKQELLDNEKSNLCDSVNEENKVGYMPNFLRFCKIPNPHQTKKKLSFSIPKIIDFCISCRVASSWIIKKLLKTVNQISRVRSKKSEIYQL